MNPVNVIEIPIEFIGRFEDGITGWQSYGDLPQESELPYFTDRSAIYDMIDYDRPNPINDDFVFDSNFICEDNFYRFMHIDMGYRRDSCGIAMTHVSKWIKSTEELNIDTEAGTYKRFNYYQPVFTCDFLLRIVPKEQEKGVVFFEKVIDVVHEVDRRGFPILLITFDKWQSIHIMQRLRQGTETAPGFIVANLSMDRTSNYPVIDKDKEDYYKKISTGIGKYAGLTAWSFGKSIINTRRYRLPMYRPITDTEVWDYDKKLGDIDDFGVDTKTTKYITHLQKEAFGATYDPKALKVHEAPMGTIDLLEAAIGAAFNANNNVTEFEVEETELEREKRLKRELNSAQTSFEKQEILRSFDDENKIDDDNVNEFSHSEFSDGSIDNSPLM